MAASDQALAEVADRVVRLDDTSAAQGCELVVVLGGDGTILRGAELGRAARVPVLGVNLGHVGFLAEAEREELADIVAAIVDRTWTVEERMALDVEVHDNGAVIARSWALNEVSVEKASRQRMLEVSIEVDGRPLSSWGCDGVVVATPTGSTAYAFSAGGPVVWPDVEAILLVPISAHALFARPLVVGPGSRLAVEIIPQTDGTGVVWCDGRRQWSLPAGARIEVSRSADPVLLARVAQAPFADRLVAKFDLPVEGWRGARRPEPTPAVDGARVTDPALATNRALETNPALDTDVTDRDEATDGPTGAT
jgi:NAD+ kinase